ncbi:TPA: hypothetical protein ACG8SC_000946 [Enterococcus faecium]|uniref:hypothetical protein n=1 Tax=Enterococcus faecium TaxID=1352 RepID=UPI0018C24BB4|nr:hypothetical protein [Enterococcus faecium]EKZ0069928.1 hypothetical protein [Enterococcus faecium]ELI7092044.1 hypothetical protein [Enterococcus faecium]MBG0458098.1 hypothetical protein [Enterococcus faecium]MBG7841476.1 hypothetical protein [Enterococcus faecium]MBJ0514708.1 hypothetical protein [Enterococcus faecium]
MVEISKTALDSLAKLFSSRFDGAEFVEYLSQNESGKTLIETLKKDYLNENDFPTWTNIEDATWDVVCTIYSPWVTIADFVLDKIEGDTYPDAKSLATSDFKTFYGYLMGLIGNGIDLKVTPKQTPEEIEKEKGEVQMAYADDREKVKLLEGKLSEEELGKMVQEINEDSNYFPELKVYQNDEDFFNEMFSNSPWEAVSKTNLGEWNFQDDLVAFSNDGYLRSYSESEYRAELKTYETDILMSYLNLLESGQGELRDKVEELLKEEL